MIALFLLSGCAGTPDIAEASYCQDTAEPLALDAASPLGFTPQAVLDFALGTRQPAMAWEDGGTTVLTLELGDPGDARFVTSEAVYPDGAGEAALLCSDHVAVDAVASFRTADGAFDETWDVALLSADGEIASFFVEPDPYALGGTYDLAAAVDEEDWDELRLGVEAILEADTTTGAVFGQASGEDEDCSGDDCAAWATNLEIATW